MTKVEDKLDFLDFKFNLITENLNELIIIVDDNYTVEFINKKPHMKILGYQEQDLIGNSWLDFVHDNDLKTARKTLQINDKILHVPKEIRLMDKRGNFKPFKIDVRAFIDYNSIKKFMIFLNDITKYVDKRETVQQLKESEEKFRTITEQSLMGIIILQDNKIRYVNKKAADMLDYTPEEILNLPSGGFINLIFPEDRKIVVNQAKKRQKGVETKTAGYECRCLKKNGDVIWIQNYSKTITYKGNFADLITVIDITDKKKAELRSQETEQTLKYLLSSNPTVIYISSISESRVFTFISENVKEMTGYNPEEFTKSQNFWISKIHPEDKEKVQLQLLNLSKKELLGLEYRFKLKNGIYHWIRDESKIVKHRKGNPLELIGSWSDITLNKKIEEKVKLQAKLVEVISDAIISTDLNFNIITWNKAAESIYGWKAEEAKRKNINDIIPVDYPYDDQDDVLNQFFKKGYWKGEVIQPRKDGKSINILTSVTMIKDINAKPIGAVAVNRDITVRKRNEKELKKSEEKYRNLSNQYKMLLESITDAVYALNRDWEYILVNKNAEKIVNMPIEKLLSHRIFEVFPGIENTPFFKVYDRVMNTGDAERVINSFTLPDGQPGYYDVSVYPIKEGILCIGKDVTEEKKIEKKLMESEERFKYLVSSSPSIIYTSKVLGDYGATFISDNVEEKWGYDPDLFLTNSEFWLSHVHPDDREYVLRKLSNLYEKDHLIYEYRFKLNDGKYHWMRDESKLIRDKFGNPLETIGSVIDITDRVKIEHELKESETRYRELFENSPIALFEQDFSELKSYIDNLKSSGVNDFENYLEENPDEVVNFLSRVKLIDVNRKALELYKANNKNDFIKRKTQMTNGLYQASTEEVFLANKRELLSLINGDKMFETELATNTFTGDSIYIYVRTLIIPGSEKTWSKVIVSLLDITKRKITEQKLKESEEKFRTIAEQTSLGLFIQQGGFIRFANSAVADISKYSLLEINNWSIADLRKIIHKEDLPLINAKLKIMEKDDLDYSDQFEFRLITKSGIVKWLDIIVKPIIYLGKNAIFASLIDISAKKKLEEELKEISRLKSELLSRTSHELKTPLVSIKGYADLLLTQHYEMLDIYTVSVLHEIKQGCYRLESLIKDLLETSQLESDEIKLNKLEDDLAFLIRFCIRDLKRLLETRKHKLVLDIHDKMITMFEKERIYEVLMNLISNAIKYTPPNGLITIKSEKTEKKYIISVKDNGIGLTDDERKKIFKKFGKIERYGKGMNVISEGSGLGLYISKKIIELHGEDIWVESEGRDKGSIFYFSLPNMKD